MRSLTADRRTIFCGVCGSLFALAACIALQRSAHPTILLDSYTQEINSLENQKHRLEQALASRRIIPLLQSTPAVSEAQADSPHGTSNFAASIGAYVKQLRHQLEPSSKQSSPISKASAPATHRLEPSSKLRSPLSKVPAAHRSHLGAEIRKLRLEKKKLQRDLSSFAEHVRRPSEHVAAVTGNDRPTKAELLSEKAALEKEISSYTTEKDPVVLGVIAKFQTARQGGLLAKVRESTENLVGSLGATKAEEQQVLLEAEAMGDVTPKEAFSQRVIALGNALLRGQAAHHAAARRREALHLHRVRTAARRQGAESETGLGGGAAGIGMVEKLKLELRQAERVAALEGKLVSARRDLGRLMH